MNSLKEIVAMSNISPSLESYLEAILNLKETNESVRITDLAEELRVAKSSVNQAVAKLAGLKLVIHERYGPLILTTLGETEARKIRERGQILERIVGQAFGADVGIAGAEPPSGRIRKIVDCIDDLIEKRI
jgi:DtxR family Mn-dependent transcriptional regulator